MRNKGFKISAVLMISMLFFAGSVCGQTFYNLQNCLNNWETPKWAEYKSDYISPVLAVDENFTETGISSLKLDLSFSGEEWNAGIVETNGVFDLTLHTAMKFDVYLPENAPKKGILVRAVITVGEENEWIEMISPVGIRAGKRTTVYANLRKGNRDWKSSKGRIRMSDMVKSGIKKIAIRVESNSVGYVGPIYIDNITLKK
ncbi:MAG: hypothetical protein KAI70_04575 [Candidatus Omnitrophica bacterium]|nr:hypothetical protein [Candidatus Omnitrophota bacterium]